MTWASADRGQVDILGMVGTVSVLIQQTSQVDTLATGLFAPYLGWLSYATCALPRCAARADVARSQRWHPLAQPGRLSELDRAQR